MADSFYDPAMSPDFLIEEMGLNTESEEDVQMSMDPIDSPSFEEVSSEGNSVVGTALKKGPWTAAEDAILVEYVTKHGEGNWNALQKHTGLSRCGKSCRLRWANHLRPDLKKGSFTPEEERRIIELHATLGNKWAKMAAEELRPAGSFGQLCVVHCVLWPPVASSMVLFQQIALWF